jgi:hypothetical protein
MPGTTGEPNFSKPSPTCTCRFKKTGDRHRRECLSTLWQSLNFRRQTHLQPRTWLGGGGALPNERGAGGLVGAWLLELAERFLLGGEYIEDLVQAGNREDLEVLLAEIGERQLALFLLNGLED